MDRPDEVRDDRSADTVNDSVERIEREGEILGLGGSPRRRRAIRQPNTTPIRSVSGASARSAKTTSAGRQTISTARPASTWAAADTERTCLESRSRKPECPKARVPGERRPRATGACRIAS
jgi:hypothetical protein